METKRDKTINFFSIFINSKKRKMNVHHFSKQNYIPYNRLDSVQNKIIVYDGILSKCKDINKNDFYYTCISLALAEITMKFFSLTHNTYGTLVLLDETTGDVIIIGSETRKNIKDINITKNYLEFYEQDYLPSIYLKTSTRIIYASRVYKNLEHVRQKLSSDKWSNSCIQKELCRKIIGQGDYGNVYACMIGTQMTAVKVSKLKPECLENVPYSTNISSWHEVNILKNIFRELIENRVCPNLPYLIDSYCCKNCTLFLDDKEVNCPCITTIVELANGNLKEWLSLPRKDEEIESALFQILAGIHTIQKYGQIMNFDVKKENILYYSVEPGGYWQYTIHDKKYKVPNFGFLFIVTDFGISRPMSPNYPYFKRPEDETFRLGTRMGIINNKEFIFFENCKDQSYMYRSGKILSNIELSEKEKEILKGRGIPFPQNKKFYLFPDLIPPFEFYNDTQDVLRMFIGGKRTTQQGNHKKYKTLSESLFNRLNKVKGKFKNFEDLKNNKKVKPYHILAGNLIDELFKDGDGKWICKEDKNDFIEKFEI